MLTDRQLKQQYEQMKWTLDYETALNAESRQRIKRKMHEIKDELATRRKGWKT